MNPKGKPTFRRGGILRIMKNRGNTATSWRKARGIDSKQRKGKRSKPKVPNVGYGAPKSLRGLHPSHVHEILIHNANDLKGIDPKTNAVMMSATVGKRKRLFIQEQAKKVGLRVLNEVKK